MQPLFFASQLTATPSDSRERSLAAETSPASGLDVGLPADRAARLAARKAFVEIKQVFMQAVEPLPAGKGLWLRQQVRAANEPGDLWLLRGPLLAALFQDDRKTRELRAAIYRSLDSLFPDSSLELPEEGPSPTPWALPKPATERRAGYR